MFIYNLLLALTLIVIKNICTFDLNEKLVSDLVSGASHSNHNLKLTQSSIPNIASRLGEPVLLECGANEHELLKQLESSVPSMPVLVNWFKHYSLTRRSDKPIYAKYLANNIDYAPHISRDYENRLQVVNKINLNISNIKTIDEALYECRLILFDKAYADSQTGSLFYLQVHVAPEFEYPNEEIVYFKPNIPTRLYCYAKGKPAPSITWYKNGQKLDANTSVLQETFSVHENSDQFEYRCKAENKVGQIEHTVKVIRSGSLFFTEPLKNLTVTEGTILNWPCLAQSNTEITYKWFKDSVSVQSHLHKWSDRGALFQDGMLYLLETFRNDSGLYECHAFTANKRIETSAYLNVLYGPEIVQFPSPFYAFESSHSIVIDCVVKSNPSVIALEWFKDKYLLSNTNKYQILPNNSLMIRNLQKVDRGHYYCSCNNTIKKAVSSVIRIEIIESKKVDILPLYTSSSSSVFKLPCKPSLSTLSGLSQDQIASIINSDNINWFKLNSKLPLNRHSIDSNGSLNLQHLRQSDSGFYLCKIKDEILQNSQSNKNRSKNTMQYSIERSLPNAEKLIKLNVIQNKSSSDTTSDEINVSEPSQSQSAADLPLCPSNIKLNQTKNGILISWEYPNQTPVEIEYFQIYYREINEKTNNQEKGNFIMNYEWKTTESINSNENSYLIDQSDLQDSKLYEMQLVSFSTFSKSLPSQTFKLKYNLFENFDRIKRPIENQFVFQPPTHTYSSQFSLNNLLNLSQLDIILIAIFLILVFILVICIIACIVYRRSSRNLKKNRNFKKGDIDDWGFQSSSAATATFLSSSSSSEKSLNSFNQKNKLIRNPAIDGDLTKKNLNKTDDYKEKINNRENDDPIKNNVRNTNIENEVGLRTNIVANDEEDDLFDSRVGDYYYTRTRVLTFNTSTKQRNGSALSSNTSTGVSSIINTSGTCESRTSSSTSKSDGSSSSSSSNSSNSPKQISLDTTSSGIISVSATSSVINGDDNIDDNSEKLMTDNENSSMAIKTIKYNAKTNILQTTSKIKKLQFKSKKLDNNDSNKNYLFSSNINQTKQKKDFLNLDQKSNSSLKKQHEPNEYIFDPNEFSGVSIDVDASPSHNQKCSHSRHWLNEALTPSMGTPLDSSNYSNSPSQTSPNNIQNHNKNMHNPFPTNHFNLKADQNRVAEIQSQLMQLNSCSSLTTVSRIPSYLNNDVNHNTNENLLRSNTLLFTSESSSSSAASTSSGCSSLETQQNVFYPKSDSVNKFQASINQRQNDLYGRNVVASQRNSLYSELPIKPINTNGTASRAESGNKKYQNYSTYRPVIKSNLLNVNGNIKLSDKDNQNCAPTKPLVNSNTSTFKTSKIDFV